MAETAQQLTTVELYGVPRLLAGTQRLDVPGASLRQVAAALGRSRPALVGPVLDEAGDWLQPGYVFVVDGRFTRDRDLALPPRCDRAVLLVSIAAGG